MSDTPAALGVVTTPAVERAAGTRSLYADNLRAHHIGRTFAGIGLLLEYRMSACCVELLGSGGDLTVGHSFRLAYYVDQQVF